MLTPAKIQSLFEKLNGRLKQDGIHGEIGIVGGAVMCLVYQTRHATKDVDAVFEPSTKIRKYAQDIAEEEGIDESWLNDAVKGYLVPGFKRRVFLALSNLSVWVPEPEYLLAMKCMSARFDTHDRDDVLFLLRHLKIRAANAAIALVEKFYPRDQVPPKSRYFIEELFDD